MTLDEIGLRLTGAGHDNINAEAERIAEELAAESAKMWPAAPAAAHRAYALAKVRFAIPAVGGNIPRGTR